MHTSDAKDGKRTRDARVVGERGNSGGDGGGGGGERVRDTPLLRVRVRVPTGVHATVRLPLLGHLASEVHDNGDMR